MELSRSVSTHADAGQALGNENKEHGDKSSCYCCSAAHLTSNDSFPLAFWHGECVY